MRVPVTCDMVQSFRGEGFVLLIVLALQACATTAPRDYLNDLPASPRPGSVTMVVEIPAGTLAKFEVDRDGRLRHDRKNGRERYVDYLPYPANYGMVPRTRMAEDTGGDGDPLDVFLLASGQPRGSVLEVRVLGVLETLDDGERDDKLVAVIAEPGRAFPEAGQNHLAELKTWRDLEARYPGVKGILIAWLEGYKGPGRVSVTGEGDERVAWALVEEAARSFEERARP